MIFAILCCGLVDSQHAAVYLVVGSGNLLQVFKRFYKSRCKQQFISNPGMVEEDRGRNKGAFSFSLHFSFSSVSCRTSEQRPRRSSWWFAGFVDQTQADFICVNICVYTNCHQDVITQLLHHPFLPSFFFPGLVSLFPLFFPWKVLLCLLFACWSRRI